MILCYIPHYIDDDKLASIKQMMNERYLMFFCEVGDGIEIISETNQKALRETILHYNPSLFWIDSIKDLQMSATVLSELVIFLIKHNCVFQSESDNIYWDLNDIDIIYPKVFEIYRKQLIETDYIPY